MNVMQFEEKSIDYGWGSSWPVYQYYQYLSLADTGWDYSGGGGRRRRITKAANFRRVCEISGVNTSKSLYRTDLDD